MNTLNSSFEDMVYSLKNFPHTSTIPMDDGFASTSSISPGLRSIVIDEESFRKMGLVITVFQTACHSLRKSSVLVSQQS